jgi:phosphoribosylformylglycinamidine cyclo-ligase
MDPTSFDLAGCCVGVVERDLLIEGTTAEPGDAIIGLASSGLHSNGFSLVRGLIASWDLQLDRPYQEQLARTLGGEATAAAMAAEPEHALATLGEVLLTPTRIYARSLLAVRAALLADDRDLRGIAHVTGGGLPGNVPRALPAELGARLDPLRWRMPSVMQLIGALGGLGDDEVRATFNGGVGMVVVVPPAAIHATLTAIRAEGIAADVVGEVVVTDRQGGARYAEGAIG